MLDCRKARTHHVFQLSSIYSDLLNAGVVWLSDMHGIFSQLFNQVAVIFKRSRLLIKLGLDIAFDRGGEANRLCSAERYFEYV